MEGKNSEVGEAGEIDDWESRMSEAGETGASGYDTENEIISDDDPSEIKEEIPETTSNGMFSDFKKSAKRFGGSILSYSKEKIGQPMQKKTMNVGKRISRRTSVFAMRWRGVGRHERENQGYVSSRKATKHNAEQFRRGPIPVEDLPSSEDCVIRATHGTLDSDEEDHRPCLPSSKGLLVYFRMLSKSTDKNEEVDLKFVDSLLEAGADINHEDRYGQTALHAIARDWHVDVVKYVLAKGAIINKQDLFGRTPLHLASAVDYHEMVEFLVLNGALIDIKSTDGQTPLHLACKNSAANSVKVLMKLGANINERDNNMRTPLFAAAEAGRAEAARILLNADAPAGVYDINGNSAMAFMVEKMPSVAYDALEQFHTEDRALRRSYFYLDQLEPEFDNDKRPSLAKTALEMIVVYKETDLVMHPVIQKLIKVKWHLFARRESLKELALNLFYTLIWIVLAILTPRDVKFYQPLGKKSWRIVLESIFFFLSIYFVYKEVSRSRQMRRVDFQWRDWMVRNLENELENCHPKWDDERKYVESEIRRVWNFSGTYSRNLVRSVYEWICLFSVFAVFGTQFYYWQYPTSLLAVRLYVIMLSISVMLICLRLMDICRAFTFLSAFIVLLGHVVGATVKFAFLFFEFFIPYVFIIWLVFGGEENAKKIQTQSGATAAKHFKQIDEVIFVTWLMTVTADIPFTAMVKFNRELASIICGTYYALVSVICINLYIALLSELFTRVYDNAEANASLQQALLILFIEREMEEKNTMKSRRYFRNKCSPLEDINYGKAGQSDKQKMAVKHVLGSINEQLNTVTESLTESGELQPEDVGLEANLLGELSDKSKLIHGNQKGLIHDMRSAYGSVYQTQKGITKSLHEIVKKELKEGKGGGHKLRRSTSYTSISSK